LSGTRNANHLIWPCAPARGYTVGLPPIPDMRVYASELPRITGLGSSVKQAASRTGAPTTTLGPRPGRLPAAPLPPL
jgi:hypothetical protein